MEQKVYKETGMDKWHIGRNGEPQKCTAKAGNCPLGGEHYPTKTATEKAIEDKSRTTNTPKTLRKPTEPSGGQHLDMPCPVTPESSAKELLEAYREYMDHGHVESGRFDINKALETSDPGWLESDQGKQWEAVIQTVEDPRWLIAHRYDVAAHGNSTQRYRISCQQLDDIALTRALLRAGSPDRSAALNIREAVARNMPLDDEMLSDPTIFNNASGNPYLTARQQAVLNYDSELNYDSKTGYSEEGLRRKLMDSQSYILPLSDKNLSMIQDSPELLRMAMNNYDGVLRMKAARMASKTPDFDYRGTSITPNDIVFIKARSHFNGARFNVEGMDIEYIGGPAHTTDRYDTGFKQVNLNNGMGNDGLTLVNHGDDPEDLPIAQEPEELAAQVKTTMAGLNLTCTPADMRKLMIKLDGYADYANGVWQGTRIPLNANQISFHEFIMDRK